MFDLFKLIQSSKFRCASLRNNQENDPNANNQTEKHELNTFFKTPQVKMSSLFSSAQKKRVQELADIYTQELDEGQVWPLLSHEEEAQ